MELALWTYEGPPHIGAMRIAASMQRTHLLLHAPQGDTYADLLFTMIQRDKTRPPVTYTTFEARDLGSDTADLFIEAARDAVARYRPDLLIVAASCTAELIQDDPGGLAKTLGLDCPVVAVELSAYRRRENWGASETFYHCVRRLCKGRTPVRSHTPSCNILGPTSLGFRNRDDVLEITRLIEAEGIHINVTAPLGATPADLARLPDADFNIVLYPEIARTTAEWLAREFNQPCSMILPIGIQATKDFISEIRALAGLPDRSDGPALTGPCEDSRLPWYSRSIDSTYLTGKRVFIFGDATHAVAAARICASELGFTVIGLGTYERGFAREVRAAAADLGIEALITDDYLAVSDAIAATTPELVLGTQMERHTAKKLGIGCAVISAPAHVQDYPARYSPHMGYEGANVIFDSWVHPLMMGLEEHLVAMFREDFEFGGDSAPSHHGVFHKSGTNAANGAKSTSPPIIVSGDTENGAVHDPVNGPLNDHVNGQQDQGSDTGDQIVWDAGAEAELKKIPFFVRGKARRNTEIFAREHGITVVNTETLYDAKAHYARH